MFQALRGDKVLWGILALLAIFSFLPVFSASTNLVYVIGKGTPWGYLLKHFIILVIGFILCSQFIESHIIILKVSQF